MDKNKKGIFRFSFFIFIIIIHLVEACASIKDNNNEKQIISYVRRDHFGTASLSLYHDNRFKELNNINPFNSEKYFGCYNIKNDTLWLQYYRSKIPKNHLGYCLMQDSGIIVFEIYERIKERYGYLSADSIKLIKKKELLRIDTAQILYRKQY